jgi:hypothetical protein
MNNAWAKAETEKQKKLKMMNKPKRVPLRSQESINEEILVNQIVSKAWDNIDISKNKDESNRHNLKQPILHSKESVQEANEVSSPSIYLFTKL